jgi:hypothetical protein
VQLETLGKSGCHQLTTSSEAPERWLMAPLVLL